LDAFGALQAIDIAAKPCEGTFGCEGPCVCGDSGMTRLFEKVLANAGRNANEHE